MSLVIVISGDLKSVSQHRKTNKEFNAVFPFQNSFLQKHTYSSVFLPLQNEEKIATLLNCPQVSFHSLVGKHPHWLLFLISYISGINIIALSYVQIKQIMHAGLQSGT